MTVDLSNFTDEELEALLLQKDQEVQSRNQVEDQEELPSGEPTPSSNIDLSLLSDQELRQLAKEKRPFISSFGDTASDIIEQTSIKGAASIPALPRDTTEFVKELSDEALKQIDPTQQTPEKNLQNLKDSPVGRFVNLLTEPVSNLIEQGQQLTESDFQKQFAQEKQESEARDGKGIIDSFFSDLASYSGIDPSFAEADLVQSVANLIPEDPLGKIKALFRSPITLGEQFPTREDIIDYMEKVEGRDLQPRTEVGDIVGNIAGAASQGLLFGKPEAKAFAKGRAASEAVQQIGVPEEQAQILEFGVAAKQLSKKPPKGTLEAEVRDLTKEAEKNIPKQKDIIKRAEKFTDIPELAKTKELDLSRAIEADDIGKQIVDEEKGVVLEELDTFNNEEVLLENVKEDIRNESTREKGRIDTDYENVKFEIADAPGGESSRIVASIDRTIEKSQNVPEGIRERFVKEMTALRNKYDSGLIEIREKINDLQRINYLLDFEFRDISKNTEPMQRAHGLRKAIKEEIRRDLRAYDARNGANVLREYTRANSQYGNYAEVYSRDVIRKLQNAESVLDVLQEVRTQPKNLGFLKEALPADTRYSTALDRLVVEQMNRSSYEQGVADRPLWASRLSEKGIAAYDKILELNNPNVTTQDLVIKKKILQETQDAFVKKGISYDHSKAKRDS